MCLRFTVGFWDWWHCCLIWVCLLGWVGYSGLWFLGVALLLVFAGGWYNTALGVVLGWVVGW